MKGEWADAHTEDTRELSFSLLLPLLVSLSLSSLRCW
jgi:hypothetical protein